MSWNGQTMPDRAMESWFKHVVAQCLRVHDGDPVPHIHAVIAVPSAIVPV
jgi:hypothetical protein